MPQVTYPANSTAFTFVLASLATSSTKLVGRASTAVVNTTTLDLDHLVSGKVMTGTSPTVDKTIELWLYVPRIYNSGGSTYALGITGTDAGFTIGTDSAKLQGLIRVDIVTVTATSNTSYEFRAFSVAKKVGYMPPAYGLFLTHDTAVNLHATSTNHEFSYTRCQ